MREVSLRTTYYPLLAYQVREANSAKASAEAAAVMGEALSEACGETLVPVGEPTAMLAIFMCA